MRIISGFIFFNLFFLAVPQAQAQPVTPLVKTCEHASNTAEGLVCAKRQLDDEQEQLEGVFQKLQSQQPEALENLRASQRAWVDYRDAQCAWEIGESEESLKRLQELNCLTRVTHMRGLALNGFLEEEVAMGYRAASAMPFWMNALNAQDPTIFWRLQDRIKIDFECDGVDEGVLVGVKLDGDRKQADQLVIGLARNPLTGRPTSKLLYFPISKDVKDGVCSYSPVLSIQETQTPPEPGDPVEPVECRRNLVVTHGACPPVVVGWDDAEPEWAYDAQAAAGQGHENSN